MKTVLVFFLVIACSNLNFGQCNGDGCNKVCTADYAPVCGTDGYTYSNECQLNIASCKSGYSIEKQYDGECINEYRRIGWDFGWGNGLGWRRSYPLWPIILKPYPELDSRGVLPLGA